MVITVSDLDKGVKEKVRSAVLVQLFKQFGTLPTDESSIDGVVNPMSGELDTVVKSYYKDMTEHDVDVNISAEEYRQVYLHLV